jgi:hypothetical protein
VKDVVSAVPLRKCKVPSVWPRHAG